MIFDLDRFFCLKVAIELFLEFTVRSCHTDIKGLNCTDSDEERI